jgi:competence protein ComEC
MRRKVGFFILIISLLLSVLTGCSGSTSSTADSKLPPAPNTASTLPVLVPGQLAVHMIDVGQGDSIFLQLPNGQNMLIDAGIYEAGPTVVSYLRTLGVSKIDYLLATHPHADHIGGMAEVIQSFDIGKVYMTRAVTTTETFRNLLKTIKDKGLSINTAKAGVTIIDQGELRINLVAPCASNYDDLNNWSAVTRVQFGGIAFLLAGDAQAESEQQILASGALLKADVLKVGHHGSRSSTTQAFLSAVSPIYAAISVGAGNDYGHPHQVTIDRLAADRIKIYRTDQNGTVVFVTDGKTLTVKALGSSVQPRAPTATVSATPAVTASSGGYIGNRSSHKFHRLNCSSLPAPQNRVSFQTREQALAAGYLPCKICNP